MCVYVYMHVCVRMYEFVNVFMHVCVCVCKCVCVWLSKCMRCITVVKWIAHRRLLNNNTAPYTLHACIAAFQTSKNEKRERFKSAVMFLNKNKIEIK